MNRSLILIPLILTFLLLINVNVQAQCVAKIDYKIESKTKGLSEVSIKSSEVSKDIKIQLYDLNEGKVVDNKDLYLGSTYTKTFTNVKPSIYIFYVWLSGCSKPMVISGEKHGILIENL